MTRRGPLVTVLLTLLAAGTLLAQSAQELYQRALVQEHASGDLVQAIALYRLVTQTAGADRALAARALRRTAEALEKMGRDREATDAFTELRRAYPEQQAEVTVAQERLTALRLATSAGGAPAAVRSDRSVAALTGQFFATSCVSCHRPGTRAGGLDLEAAARASVAENFALWETVLRRLQARRDPPMGVPRPDDAVYRSTIARLGEALDAAHSGDRVLSPAERVSDSELAARAAQLIWDAPPDASLRDAARTGRLRQPAALEQEVIRMLRDPRSRGLVDTFFTNWLSLDKIASARPDRSVFPQFDDELRVSMTTEVRLFVHSQLQENHDAVDLWTADYSYVDARLARHYGLPDTGSTGFRRVVWPTHRRAGLLGQAGVLTAFSMGARTSPTVRGLYVLTRFLGLDAPAPPANVPALAERAGAPAAAMRQRLAAHKGNPSCASCHAAFDPLGLALENFDAIGAWRATDGRAPIDASGMFMDGTRADGPDGLRAGLLKYRDAYYTGLTRQLLTHALTRYGRAGRLYEYEMPVVRAIVRDASTRGHRWSAILAGIIASAPLQTKHVVP